MTDWNGFVGRAKRLDDIDLPRIGFEIGVGEDELHAFIDTETRGKGFDEYGRPLILFEHHKFWNNLPKSKREAGRAAGLAHPKWGAIKYGKYSEQYDKLERAIVIDEEAGLMACSWGLGQVLGENHRMIGFPTVQEMVRAMMDDEENHLQAIVDFIRAAGIDDEMRALAALTRPTRPSDCVPIVSVYNGRGYAKNNYHVNFANNHNKWRGIRDTPWTPNATDNPEPDVDEVAVLPVEVITLREPAPPVNSLPKWYAEAKIFEGLTEIVGSKHEAKIVGFFAEAGHPGIIDDETPWCAAFANAMLARAGIEGTGSLLARSFLKWGVELKKPVVGCVAVFQRGSSSWQGHVAFYVGETDTHIEVLGGNQGNAVNIKPYSKKKLLGYRWPKGVALPGEEPVTRAPPTKRPVPVAPVDDPPRRPPTKPTRWITKIVGFFTGVLMVLAVVAFIYFVVLS